MDRDRAVDPGTGAAVVVADLVGAEAEGVVSVVVVRVGAGVVRRAVVRAEADSVGIVEEVPHHGSVVDARVGSPICVNRSA